ncbi:hypothetical protein [Brevundimonas sp.]|uniref:hypothetical protein n=1 Tax=Brevundimonas sp. TaxID=1871086 RepID=UPI003D0B87A7
MSVIHYAPVVSFSAGIVDGAIEGYAAPARGLLPSSVALFAGDTAISHVRAARFSEEAETAGVRLGWCGFRLPGLAQALALGGQIQVRCGVSNAVLMKPAVDVSAVEKSSRTVTQVTVAELLALVRSEDSCPDVQQLAVFGHDHMRRHGSVSFLFATYQTLFDRDPDSSVIEGWGGETMTLIEVATFLGEMMASEELESNAVQGIPGPFQTRFKFDRALLI